jgi:hypothetical protein
MWWLWGACAPSGQRTVELLDASLPEVACPESEWGDEDPDIQIRLERFDGSSWTSSVVSDSYDPVWNEIAFDGLLIDVRELMSDGLRVIPIESDTQDVGTFVTELEDELYVLESFEVQRDEFDVVAGCIEVRFALDR